MVQNHRKPLKAMVARPKTIEKPLIAMIRPTKNIQWWWSSPKPLTISNGLLKTIENFQWSLKNHWNVQWFPKNHSTWLGLLKSMKFTVFSKKNGTFLWSQYYQSWLCSFEVKSSLPLLVVLNNHCHACSRKPNSANPWKVFSPPESLILPLFPSYSAVNIGHFETNIYWNVAFSLLYCM